jgi:hypothetical protein
VPRVGRDQGLIEAGRTPGRMHPPEMRLLPPRAPEIRAPLLLAMRAYIYASVWIYCVLGHVRDTWRIRFW